MFKKLNWTNKGIKINGAYLNNLKFADDLVLIAISKEKLKEMIMEININSKILGLEINYNKSAFISNRLQSDIELENNKSYIEYKSEIIYLGQIISFDDNK